MITVLINDMGASPAFRSAKVGFQEEEREDPNHSDATTECGNGSGQDSSDASSSHSSDVSSSHSSVKERLFSVPDPAGKSDKSNIEKIRTAKNIARRRGLSSEEATTKDGGKKVIQWIKKLKSNKMKKRRDEKSRSTSYQEEEY
jgi:hypothetical protein